MPKRIAGTELGEGENDSFYCFVRQRRPEQANTLKIVPSTGKNYGSFIVKKKREREIVFQIGIRIGTNMNTSFFGGILAIKAELRGSWHDHDGGLLGDCLK